MKILLAMSGGVDSSLCAKLLLEQGFEVVGAYMRLHSRDDYHQANIKKVQQVAEFLNIHMHILDLQDEFKKNVYELFVNSYKNGITPNPCAHCNKLIKFGALWEFAKSLECQKIATGHYAIIQNGLLKMAFDKSKDQSYFLSNIKPEMLENIIFPLGAMLKSDVKKIVGNYPQLAHLASQNESSEICFVENTYIDILNKHFNTLTPGNVVNSKGDIIGVHKGYANYTIGQRKGFNVKGAHDAHFVSKIDAKNNEIVVGSKDELACYSFKTINFNNFIKKDEFDCLVKIRYRSKPLACKVKKLNDGLDVELLEPAFGVASGQLACFYSQNEEVLASGFIL